MTRSCGDDPIRGRPQVGVKWTESTQWLKSYGRIGARLRQLKPGHTAMTGALFASMDDQAGPIDLIRDPRDCLREECGVFGIYGNEEASVLTALGLHALQHRGQESCGIASLHEGKFYTSRHMGLVGDHLSSREALLALPGACSIGHVRYATTGGALARNIQPLYADLSFGGFALGHNGNLTNGQTLRDALVQAGAIFQSTTDTEVIVQLIARSKAVDERARLIDALRQIEGAYALVCLSGRFLFGARDPLGIRPLVLGDKDGAPILASETCALDMIGARFVRDIAPGEVVFISADGIESVQPFPARAARPCIFEYVYFARPDSRVNGKSVYAVRKRMGERLAIEHPALADLVVPVPDSGVPAALGFAQASAMPYELGIIRNHYVGRTFIEPTQSIRDFSVRLKHSASRDLLIGKKVVLIDDSVVRGTTSRKIVQMVREAGAREIHFRSASPPILWPDYYGIDMPRREDLMAARMNVPEMTAALGVDSLGFLSVEGLYWALGETKRDRLQPQYCDHYFTGDYPTRLWDLESREIRAAQPQLSFLDDRK